MSGLVQVDLFPQGTRLSLEQGTPLQDALFAHGVEFPCGGRGLCKGCKIKLLAGSLPITPEDKQRLSPAELAGGWRLACRARALSDLRIELGQWEAPILTDNSRFEFMPQEGWGVAVDVGTTTVVAQLLDLQKGEVLAVAAALNAQARHGADIMSRIEYAVTGSGQPVLQQLIREQTGSMIGELISQALLSHPAGRPSEARAVKHVVLVGNTVMHHLFSGISVEPLSHYPFEPADPGLQQFSPASLNWPLSNTAEVRFLPCLGGFVGSDLLAGVLATGLHKAQSLTALIDLGTNGEIVLGHREQIFCASTAAGPAFEGARISMGMRAATGAISEVHIEDGKMHCRVLGGAAPRGICGSGLVDSVAAGLDLGRIKPTGRLACGEALPLQEPVSLTQWDVRELQLAKGAIAAGVQLLLEQWPANISDVKVLHLAGAFGNYINQASARRIGLLNFAPEQISAAGNTALLGAKLALFTLQEQDGTFPELLRKVKHISLHEDPRFQETYAEHMGFPPPVPDAGASG